MANWLEKILTHAPQRQTGRHLAVNVRRRQPLTRFSGPSPGKLPNASIIYGIAASALFVIALYFELFAHMWVTGFLVMLPAVCFLGFALHFLRYIR